MATPRSRVQQFFLQCLPPILCSICVGFLFFADAVFDRRSGSFQFVWSGVVASALYYLLVHVRHRDALLGFAILLGLTFLTTRSTSPAFILRDIFYTSAIGVSIYLYYTYFRTHAPGNPAYPPFMLAGLYAIVYLIFSEIHLAIIRTFAMADTGGTVVGIASTTAFFGVLIGFGVGAGIAMNENWFDAANARKKIAT